MVEAYAGYQGALGASLALSALSVDRLKGVFTGIPKALLGAYILVAIFNVINPVLLFPQAVVYGSGVVMDILSTTSLIDLVSIVSQAAPGFFHAAVSGAAVYVGSKLVINGVRSL